MRRTEYKLTVKNPIMWLHADLAAVYYEVGKTVSLDENDFAHLKNGGLITRYLNEGLIKFTKNDFENEVRTLIVTTEEGNILLDN